MADDYFSSKLGGFLKYLTSVRPCCRFLHALPVEGKVRLLVIIAANVEVKAG